MVNYIEPNLQEIIFGPIRVGLITQKQFWDLLKNWHSWGQTSARDYNVSTVHDFANEHEELANVAINTYYPCCGKSIWKVCAYSFNNSGNDDKCPFCNSDWRSKTDEENVEELMKRVDLNDTGARCWLGEYYNKGGKGLQQDWERKKTMETGCGTWV